jgi:hypothetical protein
MPQERVPLDQARQRREHFVEVLHQIHRPGVAAVGGDLTLGQPTQRERESHNPATCCNPPSHTLYGAISGQHDECHDSYHMARCQVGGT